METGLGEAHDRRNEALPHDKRANHGFLRVQRGPLDNAAIFCISVWWQNLSPRYHHNQV